MKSDALQNNAPSDAPIVALNLLALQSGISAITLWRWRKKGWLRTCNIAGRQYVRSEDLEEFKRRAAAAEFAQVHKTPSVKAP